MLKKLLTTRIFANFFNEKAEKAADFCGGWRLVGAYVLSVPIFLAAVLVDIFFSGHGDVAAENASFLLGMLFSLGASMFLVRVFAAKHRSWASFAAMLLLPMFVFYLLFAMGGDCDFGKFLPFIVAEYAVFFIVLLNRHYSHYRFFQLVGSILPIYFAFKIYYADILQRPEFNFKYLTSDKTFLAAIILFWVLSRAHILFRDKLLDYLEGVKK
ncbi:MAG: hypothetical protein IKO42_02195 [Opitutales bacterium]|nr:hypothetical protein [Opitutales bacterium]